jgi:two-component SAPR family response regulator
LEGAKALSDISDYIIKPITSEKLGEIINVLEIGMKV